MTIDSTDVTVTDTQTSKEDNFVVDTNIATEPEKEAVTEEVKPEQAPSEAPPEAKPINPRTLARKAEKERLIRDNAVMAEKLKQFESNKQPEPEAEQERDYSKPPQEMDYDEFADFMEAKIEHKLNRQEAKQHEAAQEKQIQALGQKFESYRAEKPDFDEKVDALINSQLLTEPIEQAILQSSMGEKISYHLAQYGSDLMTLRGLPPSALPQAIKQIEAFINDGGSVQDKPRVTQAQPPIAPPGNTSKSDRSLSSYSQEEMENMPLSEFNKRFK